jgi:hypothetical protein
VNNIDIPPTIGGFHADTPKKYWPRHQAIRPQVGGVVVYGKEKKEKRRLTAGPGAKYPPLTYIQLLVQLSQKL